MGNNSFDLIKNNINFIMGIISFLSFVIIHLGKIHKLIKNINPYAYEELFMSDDEFDKSRTARDIFNCFVFSVSYLAIFVLLSVTKKGLISIMLLLIFAIVSEVCLITSDEKKNGINGKYSFNVASCTTMVVSVVFLSFVVSRVVFPVENGAREDAVQLWVQIMRPDYWLTGIGLAITFGLLNFVLFNFFSKSLYVKIAEYYTIDEKDESKYFIHKKLPGERVLTTKNSIYNFKDIKVIRKTDEIRALYYHDQSDDITGQVIKT